VRWGVEWVTAEQRKEMEIHHLKTKQEIEELEVDLQYAKYDLARAKGDAQRYGKNIQRPQVRNSRFGERVISDQSRVTRITGRTHADDRDSFNQATADIAAFEKKIEEITRQIETLRKQDSAPTYHNECRLIEIEEDWSRLTPKTPAR
jgi:hypothetical protein